jgi:hypothetical protein
MNAKLLGLARASWRAARPVSFVACLLVCFVFHAHAQGKVDPSEYRALVSEALAEFDAGHFEEARALFLHAHSLNPSARTLRGLGLASFELRAYRAAIEYLEQALASPLNPLQDTLRTSTENVLRRAYLFVGRFTPRLEPATARLRVDGLSVGSPPPILLDIGAHVVAVDAPGYLSETRNLQVLGGEDVLLMMSLLPAPASISTAPAPLPAVGLASAADRPLPVVAVSSPGSALDAPGHADTKAERPLYRNPWLWSGVAVVAVAAVVAGSVVAANNNADKTKVGETTLSGNSTGVVLHGLGGSL